MSNLPGMREILRAASARLEEAGVASARVDAELLAAHVLQCSRAELLFKEFSSRTAGEFWELVEQRGQRLPLQHLTGETGFRYLALEVRPGVFVPRPETEMVAEAAIEWATPLPAPVRAVDLCTGAGGIGAALAQEVPGAQVWAVDINPEAVSLARANALRHDLHVEVIAGDVEDPNLLADLAGTFDVVISNPPYIPFQAEPLEAEVREHDPPAALYGGGEDGLKIPAAVVDRAHTLLRPGGLLVIEHGDEQGPAMRETVAARGGFEQIHTRTDLNGRDRMVVATRVEVAH